MLTVREVLRAAGHPLGRAAGARWRTTCPLTRGDNAESFSYTDEIWHCFACDESGGIVKLGRRLGVIEERVPRPELEGLPDMRVVLTPDRSKIEVPVTLELEEMGSEHRAYVLLVADTIHQTAEYVQSSEIPRWLDQMGLEFQNEQDAQSEVFETAARWWAEARAWRDLAHACYVAVALDPVLAARDPMAALMQAAEARYCPCAGEPAVPRGTRARPRLA